MARFGHNNFERPTKALANKQARAVAELAAEHNMLNELSESPAMFVCMEGDVQAGKLPTLAAEFCLSQDPIVSHTDSPVS